MRVGPDGVYKYTWSTAAMSFQRRWLRDNLYVSPQFYYGYN